MTMMTSMRALYSAEQLRPLFSPRSIAIVGASSSGKGFGASAQRELLAARLGRPLYLVHPRFADEAAPEGAIGVASIAALPEGIDCLLVAVPAKAVLASLEEAAARGCRSSIVFSSGFGEVEGGAAEEAKLGELARRTGMRIGGPNTAGILNYRENLPLTFVPELRMELPAGNLAIVSQSAGLATHLGHRRNRGLGVSYTITTGNSVDVTALDYANFLLDDPGTDVVLLVLEGVDNPPGLLELGRKSRRLGKPILAIKSGRTQAGGKAAVSHTGSLAGSFEVFEAAAAEAGIQLVKTTEELIETGQLFARWARKAYQPGGVGVLTTMGGPGVIAADAADDEGVRLPPLSPATLKRLGGLIPSFAAMGNPIDTTASPPDDVLRQCLEALALDDAFSAIVMLVATQTGPSTAQRPAAIAQAVRNSTKPIAAVWASSWLECPSSEVLDAEPALPVFRSSDRCMRAIRRWIDWNERPSEAAADQVCMNLDARERSALAGALVQARQAETRHGALSEAASRSVLGALGVRMPGAAVATDRADAAALALKMGFPVVAKIVSPDVPHKAAAGGVKLGLADARQVTEAYDRIMDDVHTHCPQADLKGVLIAEMVPPSLEFMCGLVRDPVFGAVVLCGAGGAEVEELRDVGRCIAPVTVGSARRALHGVRAFQRLARKDAKRAERLEAQLIPLMQKLGAAALAEATIAEVDVNPLVQRPDGELIALDALVVLV